MKDLYKGRYLIAVYDKEDNCKGVASSIKELKQIENLGSMPYPICYKILNGKYNYLFSKYYFIDCLEEHDDIFKEEDEIFLKECPNRITDNIKASLMGISLRTYYRKKSKEREREL